MHLVLCCVAIVYCTALKLILNPRGFVYQMGLGDQMMKSDDITLIIFYFLK